MMIRLLVASTLIFAACSATDGKPANGPGSANEQRDTDIVHEECNLASSGAKGLDANGDEKPDIIKVFSGSREICRAVDINMDRVIDVYVYFDQAGQVRRRESGFDRDAQPDEISHYQNGLLVRKERETNNDGKIDTWSYFQAGRLVKEERDSTGDGYVDQWWTFDRPQQPECAIVLTDGDGDGRPDKDSRIDTCGDAKPKPPPAQPTATAAAEAPPNEPPPPLPGDQAPDAPQPTPPQPQPDAPRPDAPSPPPAPADKKEGP